MTQNETLLLLATREYLAGRYVDAEYNGINVEGKEIWIVRGNDWTARVDAPKTENELYFDLMFTPTWEPQIPNRIKQLIEMSHVKHIIHNETHRPFVVVD